VTAAWRLAPLLVALALLPAGCADEESTTTVPSGPSTAQAPAPQRLSAADRDRIRRSEAAILGYCERAAVAAAGTGEGPSARQRARALDAVDDLVSLAGDEPDAILKAGVDLRLFVGDLTEDLQGANCDPEIVTRLDAGLASIP
jgi:hypothetical protein